MNHYELLVVFPGKLSETELPSQEQAVRDMCTAEKISITREEALGKKRLSYDIKGEQYGYYYTIECEAEPEHVHAFSNRLRLSPIVIRHSLFVKKPKSEATLQKELRLRERVAQRRAVVAAATAAATPAQTHTVSTSASAPAPASAPVIPAAPIDIAALDKKLDELLAMPDKV